VADPLPTVELLLLAQERAGGVGPTPFMRRYGLDAANAPLRWKRWMDGSGRLIAGRDGESGPAAPEGETGPESAGAA